MENKIISAKLNDENGNGNSQMYIEGDGVELNMPESYVLANKPKSGKNTKMKAFLTGNPNVGKGSAGFASVITLAGIITIAGAIIAFLTLRY